MIRVWSNSTKAKFAAVLAATALLSSACWPWDYFRFHERTQFVHEVSGVPYYAHDEGYSGVEAVLQSWQQWKTGNHDSQADLFSALVAHYTSEGNSLDSGVTEETFRSTAEDALGTGIATRMYSVNGTCSGRPCMKMAAADIQSAVIFDKPPVVVLDSAYFGIAKKTGNSAQCNGFGYCRPSWDWFLINLPYPGGGENIYATADHFMSRLRVSSSEAAVFFLSGSASVGSSEMAEYEDAAGTYYGDPSPPEPDHPCGFVDCADGGGYDEGSDGPPQPYSLVIGDPSKEPRSKDVQKDFVPNPRTRKDIIGDFVFAVRRVRLDAQPGLTSLGLEDGILDVQQITRVRSLNHLPDYYLLDIVQRADRRPFARATLSAAGLLQGLRLASAGDRPFVSAQTARRWLADRFGVQTGGDPEPVYSFSDLGLLDFQPLYLGTENQGGAVVITAEGRAFRVVPAGPGGKRPDGARVLHGKDREQFFLSELKRTH